MIFRWGKLNADYENNSLAEIQLLLGNPPKITPPLSRFMDYIQQSWMSQSNLRPLAVQNLPMVLEFFGRGRVASVVKSSPWVLLQLNFNHAEQTAWELLRGAGISWETQPDRLPEADLVKAMGDGQPVPDLKGYYKPWNQSENNEFYRGFANAASSVADLYTIGHVMAIIGHLTWYAQMLTVPGSLTAKPVEMCHMTLMLLREMVEWLVNIRELDMAPAKYQLGTADDLVQILNQIDDEVMRSYLLAWAACQVRKDMSSPC